MDRNRLNDQNKGGLRTSGDVPKSEDRPPFRFAYVTGRWRKPTNVWQYETGYIDEIFTNLYWFIGGNNSDEIGTSSYMSSAWT